MRPLNQDGGSLDAALLENRTPLVAQGMEIVPSGDASFKKTDPAVFYAEVYDPRLTGTDPPKLGVQMLVVDLKTRQKKIDTGGPLPKNTAGTPVVSFGLRLPVDKLEPGSYELQVRAVDSTGAATPGTYRRLSGELARQTASRRRPDPASFSSWPACGVPPAPPG